MKTLTNKTTGVKIVFPNTIDICIGERYYIIDKDDMPISYSIGNVYLHKDTWELYIDTDE